MAESRRRGSAGSVDRRRRVRPGGRFLALEADGPGALRRAVAFALFGGAGVSLVPVGRAAGGSGLPGYLRGYLGGPRVALPVAAVPADVLQRRGETGEPRHGVAQPNGAPIPLRDPAAADAAGMVLLAVADVVSQSLHSGGVSCRVRRAAALFRAAENPAYRRRDHGGVADSHPGDGQLHVLQHPDDRAGGVAVYRAGAGQAGLGAPGGLDRRGSVDRRGERDDQPPTAFDPPPSQRGRGGARRGALRHRELVRAFRRNDDHAPGDRGGRLERRRGLAGVRVPLQARRSPPRAAGGRAGPTAARLADVVRRARQLSGEAVVPELHAAVVAGRAGRFAAAGAQPLSERAAEVRAGAALHLSLHEMGLAGLVDARRTRLVFSGGKFTVEELSARAGGPWPDSSKRSPTAPA